MRVCVRVKYMFFFKLTMGANEQMKSSDVKQLQSPMDTCNIKVAGALPDLREKMSGWKSKQNQQSKRIKQTNYYYYHIVRSSFSSGCKLTVFTSQISLKEICVKGLIKQNVELSNSIWKYSNKTSIQLRNVLANRQIFATNFPG